jgi:hypothetical protein
MQAAVGERRVREREAIHGNHAAVLPVMIASPGDVTEERDIIRAVLHDWNDINAQASSVMLVAENGIRTLLL